MAGMGDQDITSACTPISVNREGVCTGAVRARDEDLTVTTDHGSGFF